MVQTACSCQLARNIINIGIEEAPILYHAEHHSELSLLLKLPIVLLSIAPKISLLCSNYAQSCLSMPNCNALQLNQYSNRISNTLVNVRLLQWFIDVVTVEYINFFLS